MPPTAEYSAPELLIDAAHRVAAAGISPGSSGNISVREGARIYMTGTGTDMSRLQLSDIAVLDLEGAALDGAKPSKEVSLHTAFYRKNPQHTAVVHLHSPSAVAASCLQPWSSHSAIPPLTPYVLMRVGQTPLLPFLPPGDPGLGRLVEENPHPFFGALLANHGQIASGADLSVAVDAAIELEEACRITLLTDGRDRRLISDLEARSLADRWGTPWTPAG